MGCGKMCKETWLCILLGPIHGKTIYVTSTCAAMNKVQVLRIIGTEARNQRLEI
jgi:hypothetical protein